MFVLAIAGSAGDLAPESPAKFDYVLKKQGKDKMFGKIKKIFFTGVFGALYISFIAQLVYILGWVVGIENKLIGLGLLSLEWLILIAARYLSKRSSNSAQHGNGYRRR